MYGVSWLIVTLEKRLNGANYKGLAGLSEAGWGYLRVIRVLRSGF
jgi:hypothetical protein